ncbi:type II secretion system protein [Massilia sp. CF038]|uniref:type II secretion system protein n=1 Tax=Massilia sp. CF038 TaxID=1881045 RepID=UPI0009120D75|nr:type II secretion system protein [Massilia sp. CF038]SHG98146.1 general secretion pathway protein G [Massilia sp. CF038]
MKRQHGFSLFELAVVVTIIGVLTGTLLTRLRWYQEEAELAAMHRVVAALRSSLNMRAAQLIAEGKQHQIEQLATINPMSLLAQKPANYVGEYFTPQNFKISPGNWFFNRKKLLLVYITRTGATLPGAASKQFSYRIELSRTLEDANGPKPAETSDRTTIEGIVLNEVPSNLSR